MSPKNKILIAKPELTIRVIISPAKKNKHFHD